MDDGATALPRAPPPRLHASAPPRLRASRPRRARSRKRPRRPASRLLPPLPAAGPSAHLNNCGEWWSRADTDDQYLALLYGPRPGAGRGRAAPGTLWLSPTLDTHTLEKHSLHGGTIIYCTVYVNNS